MPVGKKDAHGREILTQRGNTGATGRAQTAPDSGVTDHPGHRPDVLDGGTRFQNLGRIS